MNTVALPSPSGQRFWWVNQNQTFRQEIDGGYLWSPKRKSNGHRNAFYEFMREVAPGDIVFSFKDTLIQAVGVATDFCFESPKPTEFGSTGINWDRIGWKVPVHWNLLANRIRPSEYMKQLAPLLPAKYSPLNMAGRGQQAVYLAAVPQPMAMMLATLIGPPESEIIRGRVVQSSGLMHAGTAAAELTAWEDHLERQIAVERSLSETERTALVQARRGQGQFRASVLSIETRCRVTKVDKPEHLVASHCKPWRECQNTSERLDGENGLMLTPTIDHLFDRGFISFENNGNLLISPVADLQSMGKMGVDVSGRCNVGDFSDGQKDYLGFHRDAVFRCSQTGAGDASKSSFS